MSLLAFTLKYPLSLFKCANCFFPRNDWQMLHATFKDIMKLAR